MIVASVTSRPNGENGDEAGRCRPAFTAPVRESLSCTSPRRVSDSRLRPNFWVTLALADAPDVWGNKLRKRPRSLALAALAVATKLDSVGLRIPTGTPAT